MVYYGIFWSGQLRDTPDRSQLRFLHTETPGNEADLSAVFQIFRICDVHRRRTLVVVFIFSHFSKVKRFAS